MDLPVIITAVFGLFVLVGGMIGYLKAKSKASLVAGSISGIVLLLCAWGINDENKFAVLGSLFISILLGLRFLGTWFKTRRFMPDLLVVLFSLATLIIVGSTFFKSW